MGTYDVFYSKLGGYQTIDAHVLYEPYNMLPTVYVEDVYDESLSHCIWTSDELDDPICCTVLGIVGNESASVSLSVAGVDGLENAIETDSVIDASSDCIYRQTHQRTATDEPRTFCPLCTEGFTNGDKGIVFNEDPARDKLSRHTTVWLHPSCLSTLQDALDGFWDCTDESLGELL